MSEFKFANEDTLNEVKDSLGKSTDTANVSGATLFSLIKRLVTDWTTTKSGYVDESISSRASQTTVDTVSSKIGASSDAANSSGTSLFALVKRLVTDWTTAKAGYLDAQISTRASSAQASEIRTMTSDMKNEVHSVKLDSNKLVYNMDNMIKDVSGTGTSIGHNLDAANKDGKSLFAKINQILLDVSKGGGGNKQQHFLVTLGDYFSTIDDCLILAVRQLNSTTQPTTSLNGIGIYNIEGINYVFSNQVYCAASINLNSNTAAPIKGMTFTKPSGGYVSKDGILYMPYSSHIYTYNISADSWKTKGSVGAVDSYIVSADDINLHTIPVTGAAGKVWNRNSEGTSTSPTPPAPVTLADNTFWHVMRINNCLYWIARQSDQTSYKYDPSTSSWTVLASVGKDPYGSAFSYSTASQPVVMDNKVFSITRSNSILVYDIENDCYSFLLGAIGVNSGASIMQPINNNKTLAIIRFSTQTTNNTHHALLYDVATQQILNKIILWKYGGAPYNIIGNTVYPFGENCSSALMVCGDGTNGYGFMIYPSIDASKFKLGIPVSDVVEGDIFFSNGFAIDNNFSFYKPCKEYKISKPTTITTIVPHNADATYQISGWVKHEK